MNPQLWWFLARATGFVAWGLLTASVIWGLLLSTRLTRGRPSPAWLTDLHRFLGGAAVIFTALHVGGLVADNYTHFGLGDVLVPLASAWKPGPVALGVIALYLLISVEVTSLLMRRMPRRWWKAIHLSSFGLFWIATLHLVTAGTDASNLFAAVAVDVAATSVVFLTLVRTLSPRATAVGRGQRVSGVGGAGETHHTPLGDDGGRGELAVEQAAGLQRIIGCERRNAVGH
jgi:predicted ferric reductase